MAEIDYNEILLEAIDAIVVSRISEVNFDRTIVATIVDASKAKDGEYVLSDGSVQFTVSNGSDKYKENDRVNVLIPSNDFSSTEKTILGKTSANVNDVPVTYVSPLEKIVPMETNYAAGLRGGITANSETEIFQLTNAEWIEVNESTLGYDTLCVSARFKTLLNDYDIRQGHYGLLVQLKTTNGYIHALTLDSAKDMFGNPYGYSMYLTQEQTYHLNLQDNIIGIKIDLYQMKDFKYNDGVNSELQVLPVMPYSNILVDNINVSFGYNAEQVEDNTVKIGTADSLTYDNIKDASVTKKLTLTWYNKDENNKYLGFSDGTFADLSAAQTIGSQKYYIKWEHSLNNGQWEEVQETGQEQELTVNLNMAWGLNEYRAIVVFDGVSYPSNIIQFKNATGIDNPQEELQMSLTLHNVEGSSYDSYPLYGPDGIVINPLDSSKRRELYFSYDSEAGGSLEPNVLNGATAYFYIPENSTMLTVASAQTYWNEDMDAAHKKVGYTAVVKRFTTEFTQYDDGKLNMLKNTAPQELNGLGARYNYTQQIKDWTPGLQAKKVYARSTTSGKKTIMLNETGLSGTDTLRAYQTISLVENKEYTFSTEVYTSSRQGKNATVGVILTYEDDSIQAIGFRAVEIKANEWVSLKWNFKWSSDLFDTDHALAQSWDKIKNVALYLTTAVQDTYTLFDKAYLREAADSEIIWRPAAGEFGADFEKKLKTFAYCIKKNYNPLFTNNSIILKIIDKNGFIYETLKAFAFSSYGTSGTDYSIVISGANGENGWVGSNGFTPKAQLYDANYKEITDIDWAWSKYPTGTTIDDTNQPLSSTTTLYQAIKAQTTVSWVGTNVQISGIYPISYSSNADYMYQGPTTIIYNSNGIKPSYYNGDLGIFKKSDNSEVVCTWNIEYFTKKNEAVSGNKAPWLSWGQLTDTEDGHTRFKPSPMYLGAEDTYYLVLVAKSTSKILWRQPLIILQNQYASGLLNNWDGNLIVDNENNYILSSMMGAGSKDSQNRFSGVLMGEVGKVADNAAETGLFGYHEGAQSFGFRTDGTAFIGKSGAGRIEFNGNYGLIKSSGWRGTINSSTGGIETTGSTGMAISLETGQIDAHDFKLTSGNIYLNSNPNDNGYYFKVGNPNTTYIQYSKNGALEAKIDKLELTAGLGGANLLKMTAPTPEQLNSGLQYFNTYWTWAENTTVSSVEHNEDYMIVNSGNGSEYLQQQISVEPNKYYTISGYFINVSKEYNNYLSVKLSLDEGVTFTDLFATGQLASGSKKYFSKTFQIGDITTIVLKFTSASARSFGLYHAQLEEGTVATAWKSADKDTKVSIQITEDSINQTISGVSENLKDNYWTITQTETQISQTKDSIAQYVGKSVNKYDTSKMTTKPTLYGEGKPNYAASKYTNQVYLDTTTGYYYTSKNNEWIKSNTSLPIITDGLSTSILQQEDKIAFTATSAMFYGESDSAADASSKAVKLTNPEAFPSMTNEVYVTKDGNVLNGLSLAVKFKNANTAGYFSLQEDKNKNGEQVYYRNNVTADNNKFAWDAGDIVVFVYQNGAWHIAEYGTYGQIEVTKDAIISEVGRVGAKAQFYGICNSAKDANVKIIEFSEEDQKFFPIISEDKEFYPTGTSISVTFVNGNTSAEGQKLQIYHQKDKDNGEDILLDNKRQLQNLQPGANVMFIYDANANDNNGAWVVSDSGAYSQIKQTADAISLKVEGVATDYTGTTTGTLTKQGDDRYRFTVYLDRIDQNTPVYQAAPIFHHGSVLEIKFTNANTKAATLYLNIGHIGDETDSTTLGYPIFINNSITSASNAFTWEKNAIKYFKFVLTEQSEDSSTQFNKGHWEVYHPPYGIGQLITNTQGITGTAITRGTGGFSFRLTDNDFKVGAVNNSNVFTPTLTITKDKLQVVGEIIANSGEIGGCYINNNSITSTGKGLAFQKVVRHTVSSGSNANTISISGWEDGTRWHNFYYKIISNDQDLVLSNMPVGAEYYIIATLPTNNTNSLPYSYRNLPQSSNITISKSQLKVNNYLLINSPHVINFASGFSINSSGVIEASGVKLLGEINASSGTIGGFTIASYAFPKVGDYPAATYDALVSKYYSYDDNAQGDNVTYTTYLTPRGVYTHYLEERGSSNGYWQFKSWYKIISS